MSEKERERVAEILAQCPECGVEYGVWHLVTLGPDSGGLTFNRFNDVYLRTLRCPKQHTYGFKDGQKLFEFFRLER